MKKTADTVADDSSEDADRKYRAPALEKGLDILELLARNDAPMTASQMAVTLERSVSELFRMISALEFRGYIVPSSDGREGYSLSNKLFALGLAQPPVRNLLDCALPVMKNLAQTVGQSCHLVMPSGDQIVVVARCESPNNLGFMVRMGYRQRLVDAHSGLLLYGLAPESLQKNMLGVLKQSSTEEEINRFTRKARAAAKIGHIESPSPFVEGIIDLCVPICERLEPVATLIVPFIHIRSQKSSTSETLTHLKSAALTITAQLGHSQQDPL